MNLTTTAVYRHWQTLWRQWNPDGLHRYLKSTSWMLGARIINTIIGFLVGIYVIRSLGPENYGQLSYAVSLVGFFSIIASLSIDVVLPRDLVAHPDKRNAYLGSALGIKLIAGGIATIATILFALFYIEDSFSQLLIFILAPTFLFTAFHIITLEFSARVEQKYTSIILILVTLILNILKVLIIFTGNGVLYLACILLFEAILYTSLYVILRTKRYGPLTQWHFDPSIAKQLLVDSWPFIFIATFTTLYSRVDQVMLKHMIDAEAVGLYDAAVRIAEAWLIVPAVITTSLFPAIINARISNTAEYFRRLKILTVAIFSVSVVVAFLFSSSAYFIIVFLYGDAFAASVSAFVIYTWGTVFAALDGVTRSYLVAENKRLTIFIVTGLSALANIVLNLILIPIYGIAGAAIATLLSYGILCTPLLFILAQKIRATGNISSTKP
jgi:O-antigen/teichoic acid export membrane protein